MASYPNGTPSWVELTTPDTVAAAEFYSQLFDWTASEPGGEESGGYQMFLQDGAPVAGLTRPRAEGQPTVWATYISVDDADATAAKIAAGGGQTLLAPMDVMDLGRMGFFADPSGAVFGIWQPRGFTGAGLVNEPVSLCWNEVLTRDKPAVLGFYPDVFEWTPVAPGFEPNGDYTVWQRPDGVGVAGAMAMTDEFFPAEVPAHWSVCFAVADVDAITSRAVELGGTVTMPAMDCPIGRFAGCADPRGATFTVMALARGEAPDTP